MSATLRADVVIIGAGITGLMLAKKLSQIGLVVVLVEKQEKLAAGASTRNEGWLHRGTYHANSIQDRQTALQVARRCIYGHEQIRSYAPEAVEDIDLPAYALTRQPERVAEIVSRWNEAGVLYEPVSMAYFVTLAPEVRSEGAAAVFRVHDVSLNTRLLYRKLLSDSVRAGAHIYAGTNINFHSHNEIQLNMSNGHTQHVDSPLFVYTTGYGLKDAFTTHFNIDLPMRYWKSHLLIVPRLTRHGVFCLDPHEAAMMNHGEYSIVGLNEDAFLCDLPTFQTIPEKVGNILSATQRLFKVLDNQHHLATACIKVDMPMTSLARSLNISVSEPLPGHICVLPGKMTEAPYVTDVVSRLVYDRLSTDPIALRPCDTFVPALAQASSECCSQPGALVYSTC